MELHEVSQGFLEAGVNHPCLRLGQDKCREPREEDWQSIQLVDTEAGSRVSMVVQSHASWEYREQFICRQTFYQRCWQYFLERQSGESQDVLLVQKTQFSVHLKR